eukprot:6173844-Pleurochrysis_carterae.AAC.1
MRASSRNKGASDPQSQNRLFLGSRGSSLFWRPRLGAHSGASNRKMTTPSSSFASLYLHDEREDGTLQYQLVVRDTGGSGQFVFRSGSGDQADSDRRECGSQNAAAAFRTRLRGDLWRIYETSHDEESRTKRLRRPAELAKYTIPFDPAQVHLTRARGTVSGNPAHAMFQRGAGGNAAATNEMLSLACSNRELAMTMLGASTLSACPQVYVVITAPVQMHTSVEDPKQGTSIDEARARIVLARLRTSR